MSVADPRRLKLISQSDNKNDRADARMLARVAAAMPELWKVVKPWSAEAQKDLTVIRRGRGWSKCGPSCGAVGEAYPRHSAIVGRGG